MQLFWSWQQDRGQPHCPGWARVPLSQFFLKSRLSFLIFPQTFTHFLPHFGPPGGRVAHPGRPWPRHWLTECDSRKQCSLQPIMTIVKSVWCWFFFKITTLLRMFIMLFVFVFLSNPASCINIDLQRNRQQCFDQKKKKKKKKTPPKKTIIIIIIIIIIQTLT